MAVVMEVGPSPRRGGFAMGGTMRPRRRSRRTLSAAGGPCTPQAPSVLADGAVAWRWRGGAGRERSRSADAGLSEGAEARWEGVTSQRRTGCPEPLARRRLRRTGGRSAPGGGGLGLSADDEPRGDELCGEELCGEELRGDWRPGGVLWARCAARCTSLGGEGPRGDGPGLSAPAMLGRAGEAESSASAAGVSAGSGGSPHCSRRRALWMRALCSWVMRWAIVVDFASSSARSRVWPS